MKGMKGVREVGLCGRANVSVAICGVIYHGTVL